MTDGTIIKAYLIDYSLYLVFVDDINCGFYSSGQLNELINSSTPCLVRYYTYDRYSSMRFE